MTESRGHALHASRASRAGSLLVDVLLAVVIFGAVVAAFSSGIFQGQQGTIRGGNRIRAAYLAQEALEALRSVRDRDGFSAISSRALDQNDGVRLTGAAWGIVDAATTIDGTYTRAIRFAAGASARERNVRATVTWPEAGSTAPNSITVSSYLSNWMTPPPPPPPDWSLPLIKGSVLYTANADLQEATLEDVEVVGNYAFAANSSSANKGLIIYNVSNITLPTFSSAVVVWSAYDIAVRGNYAYLATSDFANELKILDISNPLSVTCCAGQVNLSDSAAVRGVSVSGSYLYVAREQSTSPELYVYDISTTPTAPVLVSQVESSPAPRSMYAVTAGTAPYAYAATNYTMQELTVASTATSLITGGGDAPNISNPQTGESVARLGDGVFLGVGGDNLCELFAFNISVNPQDPNAAPACGGNQAYDTGGSSDPPESVNDIEVSTSLSYGFIATDTIRGVVNHYFHILNLSNPNDIASAGKKIYDGNITAGFETDNGIFYRESDHTAFLVGGEEWSPGSDLLILQPTYSYD